jgi:VanZ family protein
MGLSRTDVTAFRVALAVALAAVMYFATTPHHYPLVENFFNDKVRHAVSFFVLGLLADFSVPKQGFSTSKISALLAYGLLIEVIQYFLPYRTFSLFDWAADGIGLALYGLFLPTIRTLPWLRRRWAASVTDTNWTP